MPEQLSLSERLAAESANGTLNPTRTPVLPAIPSIGDDVPSMKKALSAIKQILDAREARAGSVLDKSLSLRDLLNAGAISISVGNDRLVGDLATTVVAGSGGITIEAGSSGYDDTRPVYATPPTATNLEATGAFRNVIVTWDLIDYRNHSYTEIWRASVDNLGSAALIGTSTANIYDDASGVVGSTYYYWVRAVNIEGAFGAYNAVSGTSAGLLQVGNADLAALSVEAAQLAAGSVEAVHLAANSIAVGNIAVENGAINNAAIANLAVDSAKIADAAVTTAKIADANITNAKIADATIQSAKIVSVDAGTITTGTLSAARIAAGSLDAAKITAGTITTDRLVLNAATLSDAQDYTLNSTNFGAFGGFSDVTSTTQDNFSAVSLTSVGAPVTLISNIFIQASINTGTASFQFANLSVQATVDGVLTGVSSLITLNYVPIGGSFPKVVNANIPLIYRSTPSAGAHTYGYRASWQFFDSSGAATAVGGKVATSGYFNVIEHRV